MKKYYSEKLDSYVPLLERPIMKDVDVSPIMEAVKNGGDAAIADFTKKFDGLELDSFLVSEKEIEEACSKVPDELKRAFEVAADNIRAFETARKPASMELNTMSGVKCFSRPIPIERGGVYVPGGTAPLPSSVLMCAIPAKVAGCKEIVMCTPPDVNDVVLYTARLAGVDKVFRIGGAQAIAAMTYGTESVPKVDIICGPGNQYVTAAKMYAAGIGVKIDMPAGPSEVLVIADGSANPDFVAADLLSQAEHGIDSQVVLVSPSEKLVDAVFRSLDVQVGELTRKDIAKECLKNSFALIVNDLDEAMEFSNQYAPEHLIVNTQNPNDLVDGIKNAGSVFLGAYSCESCGDYASGTNHTLPTYGFAKSYSGVSVDTFLKQITYQEISEEGIKAVGPVVEKMAECEGLDAHRNAVSIRLKSLS